VAEDQISALQESLATVHTARAAAEVASASAFEAEPVPGTGGDAWRALWEAARRFAAAGASESGRYPPEAGEDCLLCQQLLSASAAERLRRFESYVQSDVEEGLRQAEAALRQLRQELGQAPPLLADQVIPDVELEATDLASEIEGLERVIGDRRQAALAAEAKHQLVGLTPLDGDSTLKRLRGLTTRLRDQAAGLRRAVDPDDRAAVTRERDDLLGKMALAEAKPQLLQEIDRRERVRMLEEARRITTTTGITRRNTELAERYLTRQLATEFADTLRDLRLDELPVRVGGAPGERGIAYHQVSLEGAVNQTITPGRVLSQGEHRCVALAAFLAEVETHPRACTVILDDPVSSLDHERLDVVARRLVALASRRPVLVFTHDLAFALALQKHAAERGIQLSPSRLLRSGTDVGVVRRDLPWQGMTVARRVGHLRQLQQQAAAVHRRGDQEEYERRAKDIYGFLREGWERGVEEVLLNQALQRFGPEIQTQRLRRLGSLTDHHMEALERGMTKTSRWLRGHDAPANIQEPVPPPEEVLADIEELESWRLEIQRLHAGRSQSP
jgi:ABC-type hemin transport system ATPase subunit